MNTTKIQHIMAKVQSFPSLPGTAAKLLSLLKDPDTSMVQIEEVLRYDPGLTANILKLTNSAYFGLPTKIGSVKQAVVLLGSKRLIQLLLASCTRAVLRQPVPGYELSPGELWRHSIAVSVAAETMAEELKIPASDLAFTAALLHDVGKVALGRFVEDDLEEIEAAAGEQTSFEVAEQSVLGINHAEVGGLILKNWLFPPEIYNAVQWHHAPDSAGEPNNLIDIVHVADVLGLIIGIGMGREGLHYQPSAAATKRLGLKPLQLEKVASQTLQAVNELFDALSDS